MENSKSTRVTDAKGAKVKQWLHDFLSHPWVDCKEAADGADGRAECGKRGTSWGPSRYRYRKSPTAVRRVTDVPTVLPSSIFDFVPGTSPSWSPKVWALHGRTPYILLLFGVSSARIAQNPSDPSLRLQSPDQTAQHVNIFSATPTPHCASAVSWRPP